MKRSCQYCQSPLFETDTVCWHCGRRQPATASQSTTVQPQKPIETSPEEDQEEELEPVGSRLVLYYVGIMLLIVVLLLLVTRALGQQPFLTSSLDPSDIDRVALTAPDKSFSIEIPATWDWYFKDESRVSSSFQELLENDQRIKAAVLPLSDLVPDTEYMLIAQSDDELLVAIRSERLNQLSPEQAVTSLRTESFEGITVEETREIKNAQDGNRAFISLILADPPLRCIQHLVLGTVDAFLIAACTIPDDFDGQERILQDGLDSMTIQES